MDPQGGARPVGLPRTLDVQQFAAARSSELQALYNALKAQAVNSGAGHSSLVTPRHLRRRTASHNRRRPFRWSHNSSQSRKKKDRIEPSFAGSSVGQSNVALGSEESNHKRKPEKRTPSRRVRRRIELQGVRDGTGSCMRDGTRRLATHLWHAKRFPMTKVWGYCLPQGLPGRGRGSKAVFKWVKNAAVLHDASYVGVIELQGTAGASGKYLGCGALEDAIVQTLRRVLEPPPRSLVSRSGVSDEEMHGLLYGNAVLHDYGKAPHEAIAPVTTLWRPPSGGERGSPILTTAGEGAVKERQLWIWVHPSAFDSALEALSTACQRQGLDNPQGTVKCQSRRGELAQLDLLGSRALQVLQKVLRPVSREYLSSTAVAKNSVHEETPAIVAIPTSAEVIQPLSARIFAKANHLPPRAVLALDVLDPRDTPPSFYSMNGASFTETAQDCVTNRKVSGDIWSTNNHSMKRESAIQEGESIMDMEEEADVPWWGSRVEKGLAREVSDSPCLWSPLADQKMAALSQKAFSEKRHKRRKEFFSDTNRDALQKSQEAGTLPNMVEKSGTCPVLLLNKTHLSSSTSGWSIIMPITWVHAFWVPLIFAGGHAIGLRDRHWIATNAGIPYFPHDFPDCPAHAQHLANEIAAFETANKLRPPSKRVPRFTVSPLQRSVMNAYRGCMSDGGGRNSGELIVNEICQPCTQRSTVAASLCEQKNLVGDTTVTHAGLLATAPSAPVSSYCVNQAVTPESIDLDQDTAMAGKGTMVSGSRFPLLPCQAAHGTSVSQITMPDSDNAANGVDSQVDTVFSASMTSHSAVEEIVPELTNQYGDEDTAMTEIGAIVTGSPVSHAACQTADGLHVPSITKPHRDDTLTEGEFVLTGILSSPVASQSVNKAVLPAFTNLEWDTAMIGTSATVSRPPVLEGTCKTAHGGNVLQITKPPCGNSRNEADSLLLGVRSSSVASQLPDGLPDAHESDQYDPGRCPSDVRESTAQDNGVSEAIIFHKIELEVGKSLTKSLEEGFQQPVHVPPNSPGHPSLVMHSKLKSTTVMERPQLSFFVARTGDALTQVLRENGQQHALVLCPGLISKGVVKNGLKHGRFEWRASHAPEEASGCTESNTIHAVLGGHKKVCHIRVLIVVPRKGVMKENGVLFSPTSEDFSDYLSRSKCWQGVETSYLNQQAKKPRKNKGKGKKKGEASKPGSKADSFAEVMADLDDGGFEDCCNREPIGCITSTGPQGSSWSGTGICEVGSLIRLRAMQWADQRWWNSREIFLLAGSRSSPILRPVLVSIALETGQEQDVMW